MPAATGVSEAELRLMIHNVFLTPGNPQSGDDIELALASEEALLHHVCQALRDFGNLEILNGNGAVQRAREAIQFLRDSRMSSGGLDANKLQKAFETLSEEGGVFPIHVQAQNAAIIASRDKSDIFFEFSELAPENEAVMQTKGRLKRYFPGSAISIPTTMFANSDLHLSMAETMAKMSIQQVKEVKPTIQKSGESHIEERDTTNPAIVTDFLATVLSALGELARVPILEKNTREQADLFGKITLEVLPTDFPGMSLSSKKSYHGYTLFFGMSEKLTSDLLLVAKSGTQIYDLIPSRVFTNSLPQHFVSEYIHWYDRSSQIVEFRNKQDPWKPLADLNWIMKRSEQGWVLERQKQHILLGMGSSTVQYLAGLFKPIEAKAFIHASFDKTTRQMTVELPRLQLDFFAETGASKLCSRQFRDLVKELLNVGHTNWNPKDSPESLLLEIESGILIREVQEHIASEMRSPAAEENAVMQLNMGEGKSSVIVPIVAAYLADSSRLVRVVVGKPQAKELRRTLISKLGGLLNRQIFEMPFNRSLRFKEDQVQSLRRLYQKCMKQGGVLLVQPEHMLSFKLMAVEYQTLPDQKRTGIALVDLYHFFQANSRDIVDESDENFSPKFELIYTMGEQCPIELSPERWTVLQRLLSVVVDVAPSVRQDMPDGIEITHNRRGRFPRTRILRAEAGERLLRSIAQRICDTGFPGLPIGRQDNKMRQAIYEYILEEDVSVDQVAFVENNDGFFTDSIKGPLLLLRGLIAGRVLIFALRQKRWRVNYGLDPGRTPNTKLAVPYRAKDSPSTRAEFSHPDVVILLTCLSYYYEGLTDEALFTALSHLMRSDQSETEYEEWVADAPDLPSSFHRLTGVNLKDVDLITRKVFPHFRQAKSAVDYYLSHLVFPKEMKEFSHKLSSSGWDLGAQKRHATTGFSGTNDSRHVLPLDVKQLDLQEQLHTNSLVLENLLRPENKVHLLKSSAKNECTDTELLLEFAAGKENEVHVILDVGAQVLELTNIQVAKRWLELLPVEKNQEAVVFFDDDDDICVIDRKGVVERLQTSPYAEQLDRCLVFLDQAHTRGTDLRLPEHYRAAVTLGPDITKDRLVQACMRMRKLGHGQSVVFCVSGEMQSRIHMATSKPSDSDVGVDDVLMWAVTETHADLRRLMPLWAIQGARFYHQKTTWDSATTENGITLTKVQAQAFLEEEAQTIENRYRPASQTAETDATLSSFANMTLAEGEDSPLRSIQNRCDEFGISHFRSAALQEEQEKELAPEIEQERQIERPPTMLPAKHELHEDVKGIVTTGRIKLKSAALRPAFFALDTTSVADWIDLSSFPDDLLVTVDYARTVQLRTSGASADSFQRPIQWILTGLDPSKAVIISPYEAHHLIPQLTKPGSRARLHLYAPRATLGMQPLDLLRLYTVPDTANKYWELSRHLRLQLNLFAGQLYFGSYQDYTDTCDMLSLAWRPLSADEGHVKVETDGFVVGGNARFAKSPVQSIKVLLSTLRRDCRDISKTHWGRILGGEFLTEADFET
ncbi:hypothetical protein NHJ13734_005956 [Beauveria thailandica]